jgi:hypothetical protein
MKALRTSAAVFFLSVLVASCGSNVPTGSSMGTTSGAGGSTGTSTSTASSSSGGAKVCGGMSGMSCAADEFCSFPDHRCGHGNSTGTCMPRPTGCPKNYIPTCGCDGMIYGNVCSANNAGIDVSDAGGCKAPVGDFGCGSQFCPLTDYCGETTTNQSPASMFTCQPLPGGCTMPPTCACLAVLPCGASCMPTADGGLHMVCMGV